MEDTPTENFAPQPPEGQSDAPTIVIAAPPAAPAGEIPRHRNRLLVPLIAVSIIAAMLLASTLTLAITGDFSGHDGRETPAQFGGPSAGPMQGTNSGGQMGRPSMPGNQDGSTKQQNDQGQQQPQTSPPESQSQ